MQATTTSVLQRYHADARTALQDAIANGAVMAASAVSAQQEDAQPRPINRRCKRKKREFLDFVV